MVPSRDTRVSPNRRCYNCGESVSQADDANKKMFFFVLVLLLFVSLISFYSKGAFWGKE